MKPSASSLSPLFADLLITTQVLELAAAEAADRRDRQIAAIARRLRRAAGTQDRS
jgi:DNA-directed RNA polymerase specialized sigma24 family protein